MADPTSTQSDSVYDALSSFFQAMSTAVSTGSAPPTVGDIAAGLVFSDLETAAVNAKNSSPSFMVGSPVETAHLAAAVLREYAMRAKSKVDYYSDGVIDHSNEASYYNSLKYFHRTSLSGVSSTGSMAQ
jgi:hypothetical protein